MKHHIYITPEGRIHYVKDMPFFTESHEDAVYFADLYEKDIQKVKDESIPFENPKLLEPEFVIDEDGVVMNKWPDGILRECAVDRFYTINMEEKIEVVEVFDESEISPSPYSEFKKIARIAAPKKEEENDGHCLTKYEQMIEEMIDGIRDSATTIDAIAYVERNFEIKRKPL